MKKYLLISLTVLFAAAFVWAEEATTVEPKIDIDANATVTWGVDFGSKEAETVKHGFKNEASWNVKFPIIKKGDQTSTKGDVPMYGEVTIKDIEMNIESKKGEPFALKGNAAKLSAKFVFYGAYITAYSKPSFDSNYANLWEPLEKDGAFDADQFKFAPGFSGPGVKIGYMNKDLMGLDVGLKLGSNGSWDDKGVTVGKVKQYWKYFDGTTPLGTGETIPGYTFKDNIPPAGNYLVNHVVLTGKGRNAQHSKYGIGLDFSMKPLDKLLAFKATVNSTLASEKDYKNDSNKSENIIFNIGAEVTSQPIDGLNLKLGFDGGSPFTKGTKKDKFAWDMLFDAGYKWVNGGVYVASAYSKLGGTDEKNNNDPITDMAFYAKFETKSDAKDPSNLVEGLDAGAYLGLYQIFTFTHKKMDVEPKPHLPMLLKLWGAYKISISDSMSIKPFADVWVESNHRKVEDGKNKNYVALAYDLGVTFSPVEKVEATATWTHGEVDEKNKHIGVIDRTAFGDKAKNHKGALTVALKIKY